MHDSGAQRGAAEQGADPREQLGVLERLDQVVVGALLERLDARGDGVARGQHQHGGVDPARAQLVEHLAAVDVGQSEVEDDDVDVLALEPAKRGRPGVHRVHAEPILAQALGERGG